MSRRVIHQTMTTTTALKISKSRVPKSYNEKEIIFYEKMANIYKKYLSNSAYLTFKNMVIIQ